jgi:hypothetical protein
LPAPTLIDYYKKFKSVSGLFAAAIGTVGPVLSAVFSGAAQAYLFPPMGNSTVIARVAVFMFAALITFISFWARPPANAFKRFLIISGFAVMSLICYLIAFSHLVRRVDIPSDNSSVFVSIGYQRTEFASQTFGSSSDTEMLMNRGTDDEQINKLWTPHSVDAARILLFIFYSGFMLPFVLVFSLGVRYQI